MVDFRHPVNSVFMVVWQDYDCPADVFKEHCNNERFLFSKTRTSVLENFSYVAIILLVILII